jgi:hypothetical protein
MIYYSNYGDIMRIHKMTKRDSIDHDLAFPGSILSRSNTSSSIGIYMRKLFTYSYECARRNPVAKGTAHS